MKHLIIGAIIFIISFCLGLQASAETTSADPKVAEVVLVETDNRTTANEAEVLLVAPMNSSEFVEATSLVVWQ